MLLKENRSSTTIPKTSLQKSKVKLIKVNMSSKMSSEMSFNAQIVVTDLLVRSLENSALTVTLEAVRFLASKYGFSADEAEACLNLERLSLSKKMMLKKASSVKKEKKEKVVKVKTVKLCFSLPFCIGRDEMCQAIEYNKGLFTQCNGGKVVGDYCKSCSNLMLKSGGDEPECGTVSQRMETSLYSYSDAKGRKVKSYAKYMEKKELTVEQVCLAAASMNMTIPSEHFVVSEKSEKSEKPVKESKKRGRPAKAAKVVEMSSVDDMFNTMAQEASSPREVEEEVVFEKNEKKSKVVITSTEKEELIVMREAEKESKKASNASEKEFKKVQDNLNKEAQKQHAESEKKNKLEQKAAEKFLAEVKKQEEAAALKFQKQQELAAKEALKVQKQEESALKDAAKLQKIQDKAAAEAAKIEAKQLKAQEKSSSPKKAASPKSPKKSVTIAAPEKPVTEKKKVSVKAFTHKGEHYLKSSEGVVYCAETKDEVGMWNESTQEIDEFEADEELESEDEAEE